MARVGICAVLWWLASCLPAVAGDAAIGKGGQVEKQLFGRTADGDEVWLFTLSNGKGLEAQVMTLGATLVGVRVPDARGHVDDVALRLDRLDDYLAGHPLFGSVVGRYANRIAGARFSLDGLEYRLEANAGRHHIHGGRQGYQRRLWTAEPVPSPSQPAVRLSLSDADGAAGYPGQLDVAATYRLTPGNELVLEYEARADRPTHVNLTNHVYWNLAGAGSGDVLAQVAQLEADRYLPADADKIPTGEVREVRGTVMDFTRPTPIGARIAQVEGENYDHCYVLRDAKRSRLRLAARVFDPSTGRVMEVLTTQPGMQFYTARSLNDRLKFHGRPYGPYHGFCLETQHYPDSPNRPDFPSTVLRPNETYRQTTVYKFATLDAPGGHQRR